MAIHFEIFYFLYFFSDKKENGKYIVRNFGRFVLSMSSDVPAFKVHIFTSDLLCWIEINEYYNKHSNTNFAHSLDFHYLTNFVENINIHLCDICRGLSLLGMKLLCKCSIYTLKSDQWITIWWAKFELECLLLIFSLHQFKIKSRLQKRGLWMPVYQNSYRRKTV